MSALRQRLKRPGTYLITLAVVIGLLVLDSFRSPANQITGRLYTKCVRVYQASGRPLLEERIRCRFDPTCSEYSIQAVREHGIRRGMVLSVGRIHSCTTNVPMGTLDPVPLSSRRGVAAVN